MRVLHESGRERMRVLHVIPSLSPSQGGPSFAVVGMARALTQRGVEVEVAATDDDGVGKRAGSFPGAEVGCRVHLFRKQTEFYKFSWPLRQWLEENVGSYDLVHVHALFSFSSVAAVAAARRNRVPYVIRPLGVLNRWGMQNRRPVFKALSFALMEKRMLAGAAAIHYTSEAERQEAAECGIGGNGVVLPLGIDVAVWDGVRDGGCDGGAAFRKRHPGVGGGRLVLFLSRIDTKKGLDVLLDAFALLGPGLADTQLVLAGSGDEGLEGALKLQARRLGISERVHWVGFLSGEEKREALAAASVFCLPSHSENFGIAAVEAMAAGLACVLGDGVAVAEQAETAGAALRVMVSKEEVAKALGGLLEDEGERSRMGLRAARLASEEFSEEAMGAGLEGMYADCVGRARR